MGADVLLQHSVPVIDDGVSVPLDQQLCAVSSLQLQPGETHSKDSACAKKKNQPQT